MFIVAKVEVLSLPAAVLATLLGAPVSYAYVLYLTHHYGGTLGKLALGIRVQPAQGGPLMWHHVWRRSAVDMIFSSLAITGTLIGLSKVPFATYAATSWTARSQLITTAIPWTSWLGYTSMLWVASEFVVIMTNRRRRALHDFIAGTVVVTQRAETVQFKSSVRLPDTVET
jgi:uncharacterized RDD family membrane protein YckC